MKSLPLRPRRYRPGDRVVHAPTNQAGLVIAVLPRGQRLVATAGDGRTRVAIATVLPACELREGIDLIA